MLGVSLGFHVGYEGYPAGKMDVGKYNEGYLSLGYHLDFFVWGNQTWQAGKSPMNGTFNRKITDKWSIFHLHCHEWKKIWISW